jgi:hypothetical protein
LEENRITEMVRKKGGVRRHFEGWEVGLVAITIALFGTLLAVPLKVTVGEVPLPLVDGRVLAATLDRERAAARSVARELEQELARPSGTTELYDLRAFGQEFRAYGQVEASGDTYEIVRARQRLLDALIRARALGDHKLLSLRGYQLELFTAELRRWENSGTVSAELQGLGGAFLDLVRRNGWLDGRTIVMHELLRGIFFKRRWNQVTGLTEPPFELSLDEHRAFYAFLLAHPYVEDRERLEPKDVCRAADQWRLRKVEELARVDATYPHMLARGVLFYRLGRYPAAAQAFRDYLAGANDGRYVLRARNYFVAANARALEAP